MTRWTFLKAFLIAGGLVATVLPIYQAAHQTTSQVSDALRERYDSKSKDPTEPPKLIANILDAGVDRPAPPAPGARDGHPAARGQRRPAGQEAPTLEDLARPCWLPRSLGCASRALPPARRVAAITSPRPRGRRSSSEGAGRADAAGAAPAWQTGDDRNTKGSNTHDESTERERAHRSPGVVDVAGWLAVRSAHDRDRGGVHAARSSRLVAGVPL